MDSKTESSKHRAYLLKDILANLYCEGKNEETKEEQGSIVLYEAEMKEFKNYRNVMENDDVSDVLERALKSSTGKTCLEMKLTYDKVGETFKAKINTMFDKAFVRKLINTLASPTFIIEGTFRVLYLQNGAYQSFDSAPKYFYISGVTLKDQTIEEFSGSSEMIDLCNRSTEKSYIALKYSILLEWQDVKVDLQRDKLNMLEKLLTNKILTDCCIVAENKAELSCHRNILAAQSDVFYTMFSSQFQESQTNRIEMNDVSEEGVKSLLSYLYKWDMNTEEMTEQIVIELLHTSHKYNISTLEKLLVNTLLDKSDEWFSMNSVLELYFLTVNIETCDLLTDKMLGILKRNPKQLRKAPVYQELVAKHPSEAAELVLKLLELEN
ncbi:unnamed protein product [Orchesella dallaii]|uniref:BTB domain-containing protein n=1 Tax=Orchesella dallaii TaxID=48710 RepID=A0ABP1RTW6_9HEXA